VSGSRPVDAGPDRPGGPDPVGGGEPLTLGYADAVAELEAILVELEQDDIDVDVLAPKVRRAAELIRHCRAHIGDARLNVEQIVADLDELDGVEAIENDVESLPD
jgi:exodeoxyribonuclease VII small subunit